MINDYLVRSRTSNPDNVPTKLTHYKTSSFAIQNQASHVINRTYRLLNVKWASKRATHPQYACHDTLPSLISFSLDSYSFPDATTPSLPRVVRVRSRCPIRAVRPMAFAEWAP